MKFDWKQVKEEAQKKEALSIKEEQWTKRIFKIILSVTVVIILILSAGGYWYVHSALKAVNQQNNQPIEVTIPIGSTNTDIAYLLEEANVIKNADIFRLYMRSKNISGLQAGTYEFNQTMDAQQVIAQLENGGIPITEDVDTTITVIEGMQIKDIAEVVAQATVITQEEFLSAVNDDDFVRTLSNQFPSLLGDIMNYEGLRYRLEGYLFPATYDYLAGESAEDLIRKMVETSNLRYQQIREQVDAHWLTYHQILSLASIVEREGVTPEDRKLIAGVFFNRLEVDMPLQSDITVLYALDEHKELVTYADLEIDSPYNLYMYTGLTPGPVNSPSLEAIEAVLDPTWSNYYYFVADLDTGEVYYSTTIEEHNELVEQYVNSRQNSTDSETTNEENSTESVDEISE